MSESKPEILRMKSVGTSSSLEENSKHRSMGALHVVMLPDFCNSLIQENCKGGMGGVWPAGTVRVPKRNVAIKVFKSNFDANPSFITVRCPSIDCIQKL